MAERTQVDLDTFIAHEYPKVVAAVGFITGNRQDAADAVNDALVGMLAKPPAREITNVAAWILVVATSRGGRTAAKVGTSDPSDVSLSGVDLDVLDAIHKLPLQQKQVCVLHYLLGQAPEAIAEGFGVSERMIANQLSRAQATLTARLRKGDHHG